MIERRTLPSDASARWAASGDVLEGPIVVGVGGDPSCDHAVRLGLELGKRLGLGVEFVHGVPETPWFGGATPVTHRGAAASRHLRLARTAVGSHLDSLPVGAEGAGTPLSEQLKVLPGKPAQVLVERAAELGAGLLVLGPHRRRAFLDLGSTARTVLSAASCPVWVQPVPVQAIERIVAPVDLSEHSARPLALAADLARRLGASLSIVHGFLAPDVVAPSHARASLTSRLVDEQRTLARAELEQLVADTELTELDVTASFEEADPVELIVSESRPGDLLVMGTHGHGDFSAAVLGSVTYAVLRETQVPVVAVRRPGGDGVP